MGEIQEKMTLNNHIFLTFQNTHRQIHTYTFFLCQGTVQQKEKQCRQQGWQVQLVIILEAYVLFCSDFPSSKTSGSYTPWGLGNLQTRSGWFLCIYILVSKHDKLLIWQTGLVDTQVGSNLCLGCTTAILGWMLSWINAPPYVTHSLHVEN